MTGFALKMVALILMLLDHVHYVFPQTPIFFTQIGRLCAPIFIFMTANGMGHTRNPKKYMGRLYVASVFMYFANGLINKWFPLPNDAIVMNNIFATLFLATFMIYALDKLIVSIKERTFLKGAAYLGMSLMPLLLSFVFIGLLNSGNTNVIKFFMAFVPTLLTVEGGFLFVLLGIGFYFTRGSKIKTAIFYLFFSVGVFFLTTGSDFSAINLFKINFQWLMVFSLPLLLLYNGQKGKESKWFFYWFYPAHMYVLVLLAHLF